MATTDIRTYDVVVIGARPVGENVADRTAAAGLSTVIVESELVGGECSYWACEPSKALLRPGLLRAEASRVPGLNPAVAGPLDTAAVLAHRDRMSAHWDDGDQVQWLDSAGIELLRGHGRLAGPRRVDASTPDGRTVLLRARHAVAVCTGSRGPARRPVRTRRTAPWTSREATAAESAPGRLLVVGVGVVATEVATGRRSLGSEVAVVARGDGLLPRMEPSPANRSPTSSARRASTCASASASGTPSGATDPAATSGPSCPTGSNSSPTRCCSPPAAPRAPTTSVSAPSASLPARGSPRTTA